LCWWFGYGAGFVRLIVDAQLCLIFNRCGLCWCARDAIGPYGFLIAGFHDRRIIIAHGNSRLARWLHRTRIKVLTVRSELVGARTQKLRERLG